MRIFMMALLLLLTPSRLMSQQADSLAMQYTRGLKTDHWMAGLYKSWRATSSTSISFSEMLTSDRLATTTEGDKWRDQLSGSLLVDHRLLPNLTLQVEGTQFRYNDRQSGVGRDIQTHTATLGLNWRHAHGRLPLKLGIKEDRRNRQADFGVTATTGLSMPDLKLGAYTTRLYASANADWLNRRKNNTLDVAYLAHRKFQGDTEDSLLVQTLHQRRDYYYDSAGLIESRNSKAYLIENRLHYDLGRRSLFSLRSGLEWRELSIHHMHEDQHQFQRRREDLKTDLHLRLATLGKNVSAVAAMGITTRQEQYELGVTQSAFGQNLATPDNQGQRNYISLYLGWRWRQADSLRIVARTEKLQYDTPDDANIDDRDELRWRIEMQWIHTFSPWLQASLRLAANGDHIVYLSGHRSADNQWMRNIRLEPAFQWRPSPRWSWTQTARIMANYVDYDFESLLPSVRSYTYRRLVISDTLRYQPTERVGMVLQYQFESDETGKLNWSQWQEERLLSRHAHNVTWSVEWRPTPYWRIAPGYHFYRRLGRQHTAMTHKVASDFRHRGPALNIRYREYGLLWMLSIQWNQTKVLARKSENMTRIQLRCRWAL